MGLIRKAIFLGAAATGTPLVRWHSSAEAAAIEQRRLMREQNEILRGIADEGNPPPEWCDENEIPLPSYYEARRAAILDEEDDMSPAPTAARSAAPSLTDQLTEIKALLDKGVITADEHAAMRKKILGV